MENSKPILFISPVHWNYYPYRDQELPSCIAERGYSCIYLNPVQYKGSEKSSRFATVSKRDKVKNLQVIYRTSKWRKSLIELIYENILNVRAIKKYNPGAVVSTDHLMAVAACIYCKSKGIPFVFDVTDNWELADQSMAGKVYKYIFKPLLAKLSYAVTCTSQRQCSYFNTKRKQHTYLISNGINPRLLQQLDNLNKVNPHCNEVNFIGSLRDWYDFDLLIEIFREFPTISLNIYGQGPLYDNLLEQASTISNVHIKGSISNEKTANILARSLFGILPLKQNELNQSTCPIKLFDYWGAAKAVIAPPLEDIKRVAGDAVLYATTKDEYKKAIKSLLEKPTLAVELGRKGRQKITEVHNYQTITNQFVQLLKD